MPELLDRTMNKMDIWFPHLGIYLKNVPKNFSVFGFTIAWYGVIIGFGFLCAFLLISHIAKKTRQNPERYWDLAIYVMIFSIIGARLYYVIFAFDMYKDNLLQVFNIRGGGLAIYGGVIAGAITVFIYARIHHIKFLELTDTCTYGLLIGQAIGRWGNFMNREAFGQYTDNLFAMRIPAAMVRQGEITDSIAANILQSANGLPVIQVHPTFLYESMWNTALLIALLLYLKHRKFTGDLTLLYLGGYGLGRAWIEGLRTDQLLLPVIHLPVSQLLAICLVAFSLAVEIVIRFRLHNKHAAVS